MELIELLVIFFIWLFGGKNKKEGQDMRRRHHIEPGTDLEGARPKIDRYGLDQAVPVLVYEVGPDTQVQAARRRAGDKRRQIESRLAAEELAREEADSSQRDASLAALEAQPEKDAYATADSEAEEERTPYPFAFQPVAKVTRRAEPPPQFKTAVVADTSPISHRTTAGGQVARRRRQRESSLGVIRLLMTPKSLAQVMKAKVILDPPPALDSAERHFRS